MANSLLTKREMQMKAEGTTELSNIICHPTLKSVLLKSSLIYSSVEGYSRPSVISHISALQITIYSLIWHNISNLCNTEYVSILSYLYRFIVWIKAEWVKTVGFKF